MRASRAWATALAIACFVAAPQPARSAAAIVSPESGTVGTRVVILGSGFGEARGKVVVDGEYRPVPIPPWCNESSPQFDEEAYDAGECDKYYDEEALRVVEAAAPGVFAIESWSDTEIRCVVRRLPKAVRNGEYGGHEIDVQPVGRYAEAISVSNGFYFETPSIQSAVVAGAQVTIQGKNFEPSRGRVRIGGRQCQVTSWQMNADTGASTAACKLPKGLPGGTHAIELWGPSTFKFSQAVAPTGVSAPFAGTCSATVWTSPEYFDSFVADVDAVYSARATESGAVELRRDAYGTGASTVLASLPSSGTDFAPMTVDADDCYVHSIEIDARRLYAVPKLGGTLRVLLTDSNPENDYGVLGQDATHLYWYDGLSVAGGEVRRIAKDGTDVAPSVVAVEASDAEVGAPVVDGENAYYSVSVEATQLAAIRRAPLDGGPVATVARFYADGFHRYYVYSLQADATHLYFVLYKEEKREPYRERYTLLRVAKSGGAPEVLFEPTATQSGWSYALEAATGRVIVAAPKSGATVVSALDLATKRLRTLTVPVAASRLLRADAGKFLLRTEWSIERVCAEE
jgi:hypothetical protein